MKKGDIFLILGHIGYTIEVDEGESAESIQKKIDAVIEEHPGSIPYNVTVSEEE